MANSHESKLDVVLKAIEALAARTRALENLAIGIGTSPRAEIPQSKQHVAIKGPTLLPSQGNNFSIQNLDRGAIKFKEPRINFSNMFDGIQSKFRIFINQVQLITILQSTCYPT
jgi:hypothetical protein